MNLKVLLIYWIKRKSVSLGVGERAQQLGVCVDFFRRPEFNFQYPC